jgi:hypothetical protein
VSQVGKILSNIYSIETVASIIGIAIERGWPIYFLNRKTQLRQRLTDSQLLTIRKDRDVHIPLEEGRGFLPFQIVHPIDVFVDEMVLTLIMKEFGSGDKGMVVQGLNFQIAPLTAKEIENRKADIMQKSMEKRGVLINQRAQHIYDELHVRYPGITVGREIVAELIMQEEKPIYDSLQQEMPDKKTYIKPIKAKKRVRKPERSIST